VLAEVGLPALSLNKANRGLAYELWEVLQLLPFHDRAEVRVCDSIFINVCLLLESCVSAASLS
jgi:hypothetical protein